MDSQREALEAELVEKFRQKVKEMLANPVVTMSDIENIVMKLQKEIGLEAAEGLLALKKRVKKG